MTEATFSMSDKTPTIYHNPRCSKSRAALKLLENRDGAGPHIIHYLVSPPDRTELKHLLKLLKVGPQDLLRKSEAVYKQLNLGRDGLGDDDLIAAMADNPILIERPIVVYGDRAVVGRPPERVLDLFDD